MTKQTLRYQACRTEIEVIDDKYVFTYIPVSEEIFDTEFEASMAAYFSDDMPRDESPHIDMIFG